MIINEDRVEIHGPFLMQKIRKEGIPVAQEHIDSEGSTFETDKGYQQQTPWVGIANTNQKLMLQAASEFGLTPSSRSRIVAGSAKGKEPEDEMEALLGGDS